MKIVRGRENARWLPSRHNFALFRLAAYWKLRSLARLRDDHPVILVIDRHQSAIETFSVSAWVFATLTCFIAATLFASWPIPLALVVAIPVAMVVVELPLVVGLLFPRAGIRVQSFAMMSLLIGAAAWLATKSSWARFAAWQFLGVVAVNAIVAVVVFLLRDSIAQLEHEVIGGAVSEL